MRVVRSPKLVLSVCLVLAHLVTSFASATDNLTVASVIEDDGDDDDVNQVLSRSELGQLDDLPWWVGTDIEGADGNRLSADMIVSATTTSTNSSEPDEGTRNLSTRQEQKQLRVKARKRARKRAARAAARAAAAAAAAAGDTTDTTKPEDPTFTTSIAASVTNGFCLPSYNASDTSPANCRAVNLSCNRRLPCCAGTSCLNSKCVKVCTTTSNECSLDSNCCSGNCLTCSPQCQGRCGLGVESPKDNVQVSIGGVTCTALRPTVR
jgi:hypothetical protein